MALSFLSNSTCWKKHLSLNFTTGLDPNGIRIRNAQGLDAIDFFFPGVNGGRLRIWYSKCLTPRSEPRVEVLDDPHLLRQITNRLNAPVVATMA